MERERWEEFYQLACAVGKNCRVGVRYSATVIVGVFLWAAMNDRPVSWACLAKNWRGLPWRRLPSQPTMSRRLKSKPVQALLAALEEALRQQGQPHWIKTLDSKPLTVGAGSKDTEATWGMGVKRMSARGYKMHVINDGLPLPAAWCVLPMNVHDSKGASRLLPQLHGGGYVLADSQYDMNHLYDLAAKHQHQLVAPRQKPQSKGLGHRRHSPYRLHSLEMQTRPFGEALLHERGAIERSFGNLTSFGGGLAPLPAWVRTNRVRLWIQAKLIINGLRILHLTKDVRAVA